MPLHLDDPVSLSNVFSTCTSTLKTSSWMEQARQTSVKAFIVTQMATKNVLYSIRFALLPLIITVLAQREIEFFYTTQLDNCTYGDTWRASSNLTMSGGLCAWDSSNQRIYTCVFKEYFISYFYVFWHVLTLVAGNAIFKVKFVRRERVQMGIIKYFVMIELTHACLPSIMLIISILTAK